MVEQPKMRLLVAASGTGGHLFPAIATAEQLTDFEIEWLGVPDRLETQLVPDLYHLNIISMGGLQGRLGLSTVKLFWQFVTSTFQVRQLLKQGKFQGVFTTGGYIAAPAILAAKSLGLPAILHESNALPGKVTRWLSPWCSVVALGFEPAVDRLPGAKNKAVVGTPVRSQFLQPSDHLPDLEIPSDVPLIVVFGGSQGAVKVNQFVRQAAPKWLEAGAWIVHLTGTSDPDTLQLIHPHYIVRPFYDHMAPLLQRATIAISRAGSGSLTELAITHTPSILIPYPFAAEDHQTYNAAVFSEVGAAQVFQQSELTADRLQAVVAHLLSSPTELKEMTAATQKLAIVDSAIQLASLVRQTICKS